MSKTNPPRTGGIGSTDDTSGPERSLSSRRTLRLRRPHTLRAIFSGEKFHRICHPWKILLPDVQTAKWLFGVRGFFRKRRFSSNEILSILDAKNGTRQNEFRQIVMLCLSWDGEKRVAQVPRVCNHCVPLLDSFQHRYTYSSCLSICSLKNSQIRRFLRYKLWCTLKS